MGSVHHLTRFISVLAQTTVTLRPLIKIQQKKVDWKPERNTAFKKIIKITSEITKKKFLTNF